MRRSTLDHQTTEFDERNLVLQTALGLLAATDRLDEVLERYAPQVTVASRGDAPSTDHDDDTLIDFVLGLVSFGETVRGACREMSSPVAPAIGADLAETAPITRVLR